MITSDVKGAISSFVDGERSFISLDVYCLLGKHFDDDENPIHEQVREAYVNGLMPKYLCRWVKLKLEGGGQAMVWKYYVPSKSYIEYEITKKADGSFEISKKMLGTISLLELNLACCVKDNKIVYELPEHSNEEESFVVNAANKLILSKSLLKRAKLDSHIKLAIKVYASKIEIFSNE